MQDEKELKSEPAAIASRKNSVRTRFVMTFLIYNDVASGCQ